jgi:biofilm protein TabA
MIVDLMTNLSVYHSVHQAIAWIADYVQTHDVTTLPLGKIALRDGIDLIREDYSSKPAETCQFETHEKYADLQWVLSGTEAIGYANKAKTTYTVTQSYSKEKDVEKQSVEQYSTITLHANQFAIVFPGELHMPKIAVGESQPIQKAVFKIRLQEEPSWQKS